MNNCDKVEVSRAWEELESILDIAHDKTDVRFK